MFLIKWKYLFLLIMVFILESNGQEYTWTKTLNDGAGNPLFTGGNGLRSLLSFVDIDGDGDEDIFFIGDF